MATNKSGGVQGEGDYISAKRFDDEERSFVKSGQVEKKAREAADALDGPEAAELEREGAHVAHRLQHELQRGADIVADGPELFHISGTWTPGYGGWGKTPTRTHASCGRLGLDSNRSGRPGE